MKLKITDDHVVSTEFIVDPADLAGAVVKRPRM